jgi:methylated-DNA-[protein]-cysteine S-methyltransferase
MTNHDDLVADELRRGVPVPGATELAALTERLAGAADDAGLLDVTYRVVDTPFGALLVAATSDGIVRIAFELEDHDRVVDELAERIGARLLRSARRTDEAARQLDEYFGGRRQRFDLPLDLRLVTGFRRDVLLHLRDIVYGRTETYAEVAKAAGNPRAVRAAGSACSHNPVPVVVPCHRVVRSDGSIGNYLGGTDVKQALLSMEAAA